MVQPLIRLLTVEHSASEKSLVPRLLAREQCTHEFKKNMTTSRVESRRFNNINDIHMFCYDGEIINLQSCYAHFILETCNSEALNYL